MIHTLMDILLQRVICKDRIRPLLITIIPGRKTAAADTDLTCFTRLVNLSGKILANYSRSFFQRIVVLQTFISF